MTLKIAKTYLQLAIQFGLHGQRILIDYTMMYKSNATAKVQHSRVSKSFRQKQASLHYSKNIFDNKRPSEDDLTDLENGKFTLHQIKNRAKISLIDFMKTQIKLTAINEDTFNSLEEVGNSSNIHKMFENSYTILRKIVEDHSKFQLEQKEVLITVRGKQSTRIKLSKEQDPKKKTKTTKQLEQMEKINEQIKKELFYIKQEKTALEKRIVGLIDEFQTRKRFYVAQIKKLTDIITTSPSDIRKLVLTKTKEARQLQQRQQRDKNEKLSSFNFEGSTRNQRNQQINIIEPRKNPTGLTLHLRQNSLVYHSDYNSDSRPLKDITSIQHLEQLK